MPEKYRQHSLIAGSAVFYGYFSLIFLGHFIVVILLNYFFYLKIIKDKKFVKWTVIFNLINLGFFKYFYFFNKVLYNITDYPFFVNLSSSIKIILPLAISFYTFQIIALAVDTGRLHDGTRIEKKIALKDYFSFVLFFPVLVAGPIMRAAEFFPNLQNLRPDKEKIYRASYLMMSGLIKKMLIADSAALIIAPVYNEPSQFDSFSLFMAGIGYTLQVYFDFSGLTDMARSVGLFLGIELPENFRAPFFSTSGAELWRRWHITLSFWLRDYIYFPLGGSRVGEFRSFVNLAITMTLGGIWHGADYTFIAWGGFWGLVLGIERMFTKKLNIGFLSEYKFIQAIKTIIVLVIFSISGLMFRSNTTQSMIDLFKGIFTNSPGYLSDNLNKTGNDWLVSGMNLVGGSAFKLDSIKNLETIFYLYIFFYLFHYLQYKPEVLQRFRKFDPYLAFILGIITIFMIATLSQGGNNFIYYQF